MRLAVKMYGDCQNPREIPPNWPAEVLELSASSPSPGHPWLIMTPGEYRAYRAKHMAKYLEWEKRSGAKPKPEVPAPTDQTPAAVKRPRPHWKAIALGLMRILAAMGAGYGAGHFGGQ